MLPLVHYFLSTQRITRKKSWNRFKRKWNETRYTFVHFFYWLMIDSLVYPFLLDPHFTSHIFEPVFPRCNFDCDISPFQMLNILISLHHFTLLTLTLSLKCVHILAVRFALILHQSLPERVVKRQVMEALHQAICTPPEKFLGSSCEELISASQVEPQDHDGQEEDVEPNRTCNFQFLADGCLEWCYLYVVDVCCRVIYWTRIYHEYIKKYWTLCHMFLCHCISDWI